MGIRDQLRALQRQAAAKGIGAPEPLPLCVECRRRNDDEVRPAGVHWREVGGGRSVPEIVLDPDDAEGQIDKYLAEIGAALAAPDDWYRYVLVIVAGPERVAPPLDLPEK